MKKISSNLDDYSERQLSQPPEGWISSEYEQVDTSFINPNEQQLEQNKSSSIIIGQTNSLIDKHVFKIYGRNKMQTREINQRKRDTKIQSGAISMFKSINNSNELFEGRHGTM